MKFIILFLALLALGLADRRFVSRPIQTTYNQYGKVDSIVIQWRVFQPIYSNDYIKVTLPQIIHDSSLLVSYSILTAHNLNIMTSRTSLTYVGGNSYFLPVLTNLSASEWYELRIRPTKTMTFVYGLVQLSIVSRQTSPNIMHSWDDGFEYYHLEQNAVPQQGILYLNVNNTLSTSAGDRYLTLLQIQSTILINQTVQVTIDFSDFNITTNPNLTIDTAVSGANKGFIFVGSCYARCDYGDIFHACIQSEQCLVTSNSITITLPYMKPNELYLIESYVVNPPYVSSVGIEAYWKDNGGRTVGLAFANDLFQVLPITIKAQQIRLLWNIPYNTVTTQMDLGLFVNDPLVKHQSLSTFDIGFSVSDFTPIQGQYQVKITVGASSVLQNSINHNLPSLKTTTKIMCRYTKPDIICTGVDAFTLKNFRYYVRARGYFLTTDNLASFGNVAITLLNLPNNLFINLVRGLTVKKVINSDYHDYGGLHEGTSNFRISQTLVTSNNDSLLANSTSNSILDFLTSQHSIVGVDPTVSPLQLLFFLKVNLNQMSLPSPSTKGQNYTMKLFTNPNIMNTTNLGIQFNAYSSTNKNWDVMNSPCYVDSSTTPTIQKYMCQKYNDHVYNHQIDNTYIKTNNYGLYTSVCGTGQVVTCASTDCSNACRILRGGFASSSMATGNAGTLSIRNVTFIKDYQSPVQAGPNNFDFVLAFYQNGTFVSSSLINAYTFNRTRLKNVRADLINHYHDNTLKNQGNRIPTLLKISGSLTLQQAGKKIITEMRVHFPTPLSISNFKESNNFNNIGCSTNKCTGYIGGLTNVRDNWVTENCVSISNLPSLTQQFSIVFPVVYDTPLQFLQVTLSFIQFDGKIAGVYRINGSSVNETLSSTNLNYIALPWTPVSLWSSSAVEWVNQPTLYRYKQSVDLTQIIPYAPLGTINMGTTLMPTNDTSPSTTFASAYLNIFSNYSNPIVDSNLNCINPFPYTYMNSYKIWTLWCPIITGSINQIKYNYPLYPDSFGTNFPYNMIFTYAYANTQGRMIGYRVEQAVGGASQTCTTQKGTTYDKNSNNPQQNQYQISLNPFTLTPPSRTKFRINLSIPVLIPMTFIDCRAQQSTQFIDLGCSIITQASNSFKLQLLYSGTVALQLYTIKLYIKSVKSSTATILTSQLFNVTVQLPFTDSVTGLASFTGTNFTPYSSIIAKCSNSFSFSSVSSQELIYLSKANISSPSAGFYGNIWFSITFSSSRTTFFDTSTLVISFSEPILTQYSRCQLNPNSHFFVTSSIDATNKILTLTPQRNILDFTLTLYTINCSKIITNGNNVSINVLWKDSTYNIQTTFSNAIASHTDINSATTPITGTLVSKLYNSPGHLGQYLFNLNLATVATEKFMVYVNFPLNHVHETFLECEYLNGTVWIQVVCFSRVLDERSDVYLQFVGVVSSNIQIKIYGIHQTKLAPTTIKVLVKKLTMTTGGYKYYISNIADTATTDITSNPIIVHYFTVDTNSILYINYSMPILHSRQFYVRFDELFRIFSTDTMTCKINMTTVNCKRVRPDLLLINTTINQTNGYINMLTISFVNFYYSQNYDPEEVHFSLFIASTTKDVIQYGSHEHLQKPLLASDLSPPQTLIWQIPSNIFNSAAQIVYVGYYGPPAQIITSTSNLFKQSFTFNYSNSLSLSVIDMSAELGTYTESTYIGTLLTTGLGYYNMIFTHSSTYWNLPALPIYISSERCTLKTQYAQYNIFSGGLTIPIYIDISSCRPMDTMTVETAINTQYITADPTLSTKTVSFSTEAIYIVLSHQPVNVTVGQSFQLKISLKSNNSIVQNAFNQISNVTINIIDRGLLIGNPEAKQPVVNNVTQNSINMGIQCNTPATIYWGIGLYPTMLGITFEEIQARLIDQKNGLIPQSIDIYSWSHEIYGLDYINDFNILKNITIQGLEGGLNYVYKYFCVDQTGKASGGKISLITTLPSNYSLMKISLNFNQQLTYTQVNQMACGISQQLIIPYNETITSVHSNCINNTQVYHTNTSVFYDQKTNDTNAPFRYFFYVSTNKITTQQITYNLVNLLPNNKVFLNNVLPYYSSMRSDSLLNNYQPIINSVTVTVRRTSFTILVNVGLSNTYLIAAVMDQHFNQATMSLPTHYLMKEGYFSLGTKFDQIYSIYGRNNISVTFQNLSEGSNFSVFYFTTVDNPALNSRHSAVLYKDFTTNINTVIDLGGQLFNLGAFALLIVIGALL